MFSGWLEQPVPDYQVPSFAQKYEIAFFYHVLLALGLLDDSEFEINDVLDEDNNITFIVGI